MAAQLVNGVVNGDANQTKKPRIEETKVTVVLGTQWGDEGKGKIVDMLATTADIVCRCQGLFTNIVSSAVTVSTAVVDTR